MRVFAFEAQPKSPPTSTAQRLSLGNAPVSQGKQLWAKLDMSTRKMWVRFDHLVLVPAGRVIRESRWEAFAVFKIQFPRAQKPFRRDTVAATMNNRRCTVANLAAAGDVDDDEPSLVFHNANDRLNEDEELDWEPTLWEIDEDLTREYWLEEYSN